MKKLLLLSVLMLSSHVASLAQSIVYDGNEYLLLSNGEAALNKVRSAGFRNYAYDECTIPETIESEGKTYTVTKIERNAFWISFAKTVHLPKTIKSIAWEAFYRSMTSTVNIPEGVESLDANAFSQSDIRELTIPATTEIVTDQYGSYFFYTPKLLNIFVGKSHPKLKDIDGVLCSHDGTLIKYPEARSGVYVVPEGIKKIGMRAFRHSHLDKLVFSEGVEEVEAGPMGQYNDFSQFTTKYMTPRTFEVYVGSTVKDFNAAFTLTPEIFKSIDIFFFSKEPPHTSLGTIHTGAKLTLHVPYGCKKVYSSKLSMNYIPDNMKIVEMEEGADLASFGLSTAETFRTDTYNQYLDARWPLAMYDNIPYFIISGAEGPEAAVADQKFYAVDHPDVIVPEYITINDIAYPVTEIDDFGFGPTLRDTTTVNGFRRSLPTTITLNSRIRRIGVQAFNASYILSITLPESLEEIDSMAFLNTKKLTEITCLAKTPPACSENVWYKSREVQLDYERFTVYEPSGVDRTLYVPEGTADLYRTAPGWKDFSQIVEIGTNKIDAVQNATDNSYGNNIYYDLQGHHLKGEPTKGVYIWNGKKFIVK